jgi:hypothetical protein
MEFMGPHSTVAHEDHAESSSIVMAFAKVKYWARKAHGPRAEGQRPDQLEQAAQQMVDALEATWRAGYKPQDVVAAIGMAVRRREAGR